MSTRKSAFNNGSVIGRDIGLQRQGPLFPNIIAMELNRLHNVIVKALGQIRLHGPRTKKIANHIGSRRAIGLAAIGAHNRASQQGQVFHRSDVGKQAFGVHESVRIPNLP